MSSGNGRQSARGLASTARGIQPTAATVTKGELDVLFMCLAQRRDFFLEAQQSFQDVGFNPDSEIHYEILWRALQAGYAQTSVITPLGLATLLSYVLAQYGERAPTFIHQLLLSPNGYVALLFAVQITASDVDIARGIWKRFLVERRVEQPLKRILSSATPATTLTALPGILEQASREVATITAAGHLPAVSVASVFGSSLPPPVVFDSTGIDFMDRMLGGQVRGTVNGLLGLTGGGKTTLAIHKAVASARQAYVEATRHRMSTGQMVNPEMVIFVTAEESAEAIRPRMQSTAFSIPRATLENLTDWEQLTGNGSALNDYELHLSADRRYGPLAGSDALLAVESMAERDRYRIHYPWFTQCCVLLDLSGSPEFPTAGTGYIPELESIISRLVESREQNVREVIIDWAGVLCNRHIQATNKNEDYLRHLLNSFGDDVKRNIANRFNCTAWITHQLKTKLGTAQPGRLMHHTEAAEASGFAVHMTTVGCLGAEDKRTGVRLLNFSKTRLNASTSIRPIALRIHDKFCEMEEVVGYEVDTRTNRLVSSEEAQQIGGFDD